MATSKKCLKCRFFEKQTSEIGFCCYWERVGNRRPCEPGDECTVMEPRTRKRKGGNADGTA